MPKLTFHGSAIEPLEARIAPATFTVTTAADSGPGSLRQAILDANALAGPDVINFTYDYETGLVISLLSQLPTITDALSIAVPERQLGKVRLDGSGAGAVANGLVFDAFSSVYQFGVSNLDISGFGGDGIVARNVASDGADFRLVSNSIHDNGGDGVKISGSTEVAVSLSKIYNNRGSGVAVENSSKVYVGSDMAFAPGRNGNEIHDNGHFGVVIRGGSENSVGGNTIAKNGLLAEAGAGGGILVADSKNTSIGGFFQMTAPGGLYVVGNNINSNEGVGILIDHSNGTVITGNTISANAADGVRLDAAVGTTFAKREVNYSRSGDSHYKLDKLVGNTITSNGGWGIEAINGSAQVDVRGNSLVTNANGGMLLDGVTGAKIGGLLTYYDEVTVGKFPNTETYKRATSVDGNTFDAGALASVVIKSSFGVQVIGNQYSGSGISIDLGGDGATLNDAGDIDDGANHLQNYPSLTYVAAVGSSLSRLTGLLDTDAPSTKFLVQAYTYDGATSTFSVVGTQEITTNSNGDGTVLFSGLNGPMLFATATNLTTGETSEMSLVATVPLRVDVSSTLLMEGNNGLTSATLTVTLNKASEEQVSVKYQTSNGTALADSDFTAVSGTLVFAPGETTKTITIPVIGDAVQEVSEAFYVDLSNAQGASMGEVRGEVKIVNDDGLPTISIDDAVVVEGSSLSGARPGYTEYQYRVTLSGASLDPVTVRLKSAGGTATVGEDYDVVDEVVAFAPGVTTVTKTVFVKNDVEAELNESIGLHLSEPSAGVLGKSAATLTVADDDAWLLVMDPVEVVEGSKDGMKDVAVKVRLVNSLGLTDHAAPIQVSFLTSEGSATRGVDFVSPDGVLTFQPGEMEKIITIQIAGDRDQEENESFGFQFGNPIGAKVPAAPGTVTILDDDIASLLITKGGRQATWVDGDGDRVKLTANKPVLSIDSLIFGQSESGGPVLESLVLPGGKGSPVSLNFAVTKQPSGDGLLNLETIDATGQDLGSVRVDGNLGAILAGDSNLKTPGIRELVVNSFGSQPSGVNLAKLESVVQGGIDVFRVKNDFTDAHLDVQGGKLGSLKIGGSIADSLITVGEGGNTSAARVGKVSVRGDWMTSSLAVGASAGVDELSGTEDDLLTGGLVSKIAQISIGGIVAGTPEAENATDHFGFIAGEIAALQVGKTRLPLSASETDVVELGETADVALRELLPLVT
jgi:parallel beta-helix repeat protein